MHWLIIYDIADPKRLLRVGHALEDFGDRLQESVFLCDLEDSVLDRLEQRLADLIDATEDTVRYFPLCGHDVGDQRADGRSLPPPLPPHWIT